MLTKEGLRRRGRSALVSDVLDVFITQEEMRDDLKHACRGLQFMGDLPMLPHDRYRGKNGDRIVGDTFNSLAGIMQEFRLQFSLESSAA